MRIIKKTILAFLSLFLLAIALDIGYRLLPIVKSNESYRSFFPESRFSEKMKEPVPEWMEKQIASDFQEIRGVTAAAVEETYRTIRKCEGSCAHHYRILDNKLYKYIPRMREYSSQDTPLEKAIKTLLLTVQLPDLDFVLCPMDGIPEPYLPKDFYLTENQAPVIAKAKLSDAKHIVLIPDQFSLSDDWFNVSCEVLALNEEISWEKKMNQAVWRGTLTDTGFPDHVAADYSNSPRYLLSRLSALFPDWIDAAFTEGGAKENMVKLQKENLLKNGLSKRNHLLSKYQPVVDGHMCTYPGYQWRLLSNSVAFKQESNQLQWFYGALEPYKHYVPVQNDLGDLLEKIEWAKENDEEVRKISEQARQFAANNLLLEDNYKYLYLILNRYALAQDIDFREIKQETLKDRKWKCIQYRSRLRLMKMLQKRWKHIRVSRLFEIN